ncbi:unnamed protein product, partial [Didymodactylos carnosus]
VHLHRNLSAHHSDDVLILEARDRLGGRTWSSNVLDHKFEMGGQWVHWNQPHVFSEMQRYHMGTDLEDTKASYDLNTLIFNHDGQGAEALSNPIEILKEMDICAQDFFDVDGQRGRLIFPQPYSPLLNIDHIKKYDHLSVQDRFNEISSKHSAKIIALTSSMIASFGNDDPNRVGFIDALKCANYHSIFDFAITNIDSSSGTFIVSFINSNTIALSDETIPSLIKVFKKDLVPSTHDLEFTHVIGHDWILDPYSKGVWCCFGPGVMSSDGYRQMSKMKVTERLWMVSSDWADGWRGFIDGAIEMGAKAAWSILSEELSS